MRIPASTYRLQITSGFDLHAAAGRLAYLHDLGVDWVYLSPLLEAAAGSTHGYDVVDPSRVDESRGGSEGLAALSAEARRLGMGVLVDIVPNHMGVAVPEQNPWWWDLLRRGRGSAYADAFDVDWAAPGNGRGNGRGDGAGAGRRRRRPARRRADREPARRRRGAALPRHGVPDRARHPRRLGRPGRRARTAALPAGVVAARRQRPELPAVLHDHDARGHQGRGPRGARGVARRDPSLVRRRAGRRAAGRPPGRAPGPARLPRRPRRHDLRLLRAGGEDPRARRAAVDAPGRPPARPGTTRWG